MKINGPRAYSKEWVINGNLWVLKFVKAIDERGTMGLNDPGDKLILIRQGLGNLETLKTFFHEWIHSAEEEWDFSLNHKHVYKLEEAFVDLIFNNFEAFQKLFKD